ncbi:MAG TPA: imidazole glycerol phosphate synthase subunit HisH [Thermoanaerobaculia bacterium]|jgi:glutamine amidotransferase
MNITLIDSPVANVANIARALRTAGAGLRITRDAGEIASARKLVLPGVGSFVAAMRWLEETSIDIAIKRAVHSGASLLGICVGHQLLFDVSYEMGTTPGLGLVRGDVRKFEGPLPVPQIGWNRVTSSVLPNASYYFVNSYAVLDSPHAIARADYGGPFVAAVQKGRVFGVQFHPEKSSKAGLQVLRNFVAWT